jgi:o-succinylbenzoate synthase
MIHATFFSYRLDFKEPSGTSRGVLRQKESFFLQIIEDGQEGWGEVGILRGLSADDTPALETQLSWTAKNIHLGLEELFVANQRFPSIQFALEQAFSHLKNGFCHFPSDFTSGRASQAINGLIWMGDQSFMMDQIEQRLAEGFKTLKMKIGAISWNAEKILLKGIRERFSATELEIRVDANGSFELDNAVKVSGYLSDIQVHSIEQPIPAGNNAALAKAVRLMQIPIALDESLIGLFSLEKKRQLLDDINPPFIILKPSFIGGWGGSSDWVTLAEERGIQWWATSALESNVGLNAIAQWVFTKKNKIPQGLGTGSLYTNNIPGPLQVLNGEIKIRNDANQGWDLSALRPNILKQ